MQELLAQAKDAHQQGDSETALTLAQQVLAAQPQHAEAHQIAAFCHANAGRIEQAMAMQRQAIHLVPTNPQLHYNYGVFQQQQGNTELAMLAYQQCLRLNPTHCDALWNYGDVLRLNEHFSEALICLERLRELNENYPGLYHRLAVIYNGLGRAKAAARCFEAAIADSSESAELTKWEYSHVLLGEGQMRAGWQAYESRYKIEGNGKIVVHPFEYPRWLGEPLEGKTLLIHGEQGIGDEIMFASIIPQLLSEKPRQIIVACHPSLCRLFSDSFPDITTLPHRPYQPPTSLERHHPIDFEVPICSIAKFRGPYSVNERPSQSYLLPNPERIAHFQAQLHALAPIKKPMRVGLMWSANPATGSDWGQRRAQQKSVPIEQLSALNQFSDQMQFVSLQNKDSGAQAAHAPGLDMLDLHDQLLDFADTAALASCLDLIITVDTSVSHLAGGLGLPSWVLLKHNPDWRWLNKGESSYWYQSSRLFRQQQKNNWRPVLDKVCETLKTEYQL
jgi:Tfp pilus assembly protein PilF